MPLLGIWGGRRLRGELERLLPLLGMAYQVWLVVGRPLLPLKRSSRRSKRNKFDSIQNPVVQYVIYSRHIPLEFYFLLSPGYNKYLLPPPSKNNWSLTLSSMYGPRVS